MGDCDDPRYSLKVEMKHLTLSDDSKRQIQDTLKFLHGEEFIHKAHSAYKDRKMRLDRQYWIDRGNLVVQGGQSFVKKDPDSVNPDERINRFAISKLEKYGFYKNHCVEALNGTNGDVGSAYELLMCRYFNLAVPEATCTVPANLLEERALELDSLRSIYDQCCEERLPNTLWVFHLDLPYLGEVYMDKKPSRTNTSNRRNKDICRFYFNGSCRFANKCRFSHELPARDKPQPVVFDENKNKFELQVRFPIGCQYPLEIPLVSLVAKSSDFPPNTCLRLTNRLIIEAQESMKLQQPCIYTLLELLSRRPEEILKTLQGRTPIFYDPELSLFPEASSEVKSTEESEENGDAMYSSGNSSKKTGMNPHQIERIDQELARRHQMMVNNPKFPPVLKRRQTLPAWSKCDEVLDTINKNQVVIISGETGCGKSTQVPQFILDEWLSSNDNRHVEIVCTQPRRISAIGVAERVASERLERIGDSIGYQIRLETRTSSHTRLTFCTTGILLRRLESDPYLKSVSHIIVDEVHERSVESDFLLLILKDLLAIRPEVKIILMSATINSALFQSYFDQCPTIEIPGKAFPVEQFFLENIIKLTGYNLEEYSEFSRKVGKQMSRDLEAMEECDDINNVPIKGFLIPDEETNDEYLPIKQLYYRYWAHSKEVCKAVFLTDTQRVNFELVEVVIEYIVTGDHKFPREGTILVFLPGIGEIKEVMARLEGNPLFHPNNREFLIIPLHSTLTNEEQALVFRRPRYGERKIVLSTNIAETSITIDDCVFVIDCGKMKEKGFDSNKNMESLELVNESQANAVQRRGRAGRVMPGYCFHLFTEHRFRYIFKPQPVPEIRRVPLEQLILRIKTLSNFENKKLASVIENILEPPTMDNVNGAVTRLQNVGALDDAVNLTPLGRHLASLPVDVRIGKLILYGAMFCALDSALTIAAFLSYKSPFMSNVRGDDSNKKKNKFVTSFSDHLTTLQAYKAWQKAIDRKGMRGGFTFAKENNLSSRTLTTLADMKFQYLELLGDIGFIPGDLNFTRRRPGSDSILAISGPELNVNGENHKLLSSILCASLYPNIVKVLTPNRTYQETMAGAVPLAITASDLVYKTKTDGYVCIHPSSVNSTVGNYPSPYLVFQEKVKTSKIFIRDCTMVPILPLVLFSAGKLKVELNCDEFIISIDDGWIIFPVASNETAELLESIKAELVMLLDQKIKEPKMNLQRHPKGKKIISTIVQLVSTS